MAIEMPSVPVAKAVDKQPELEPEDIASVITQMILGHQVFVDIDLLMDAYLFACVRGDMELAKRLQERVEVYDNIERKFAHLVEEMKNNA